MKKLLILFLYSCLASGIAAQSVAVDSSRYPRLTTFTAQQDHDEMMKQLGIKSLRPGPSGDEKAPNHANYDETIANPCPQLPDVLTQRNGNKVTSPEIWWKQRRPELVEDIEREMYGRLPKKNSDCNLERENYRQGICRPYTCNCQTANRPCGQQCIPFDKCRY